MVASKTLPELLANRALRNGTETAFHFEGKAFLFGELWTAIRKTAGWLLNTGIRPGDRILLAFPNCPDFFNAFFSIQLTGAIPVPVFPTISAERVRQLMATSGAGTLLLPADTTEEKLRNFQRVARCLLFTGTERLPDPEVTFPTAGEEDLALIQLTSGSTEFPRAVPITYRQLLTNIRQMTDRMRITSSDVFVSWLPLFHDMGLILGSLVPFYTGAVLVLLPQGLHRVHGWLSAIEQYGGTFVAAPDTAYRLCVKAVADPSNYNLKTLRVALNASEPVRGDTFRLFEETFGLQRVMIAGYGLAEATVGVTMQDPGEEPFLDREGHVASGRPLDGVQIRIIRDGIDQPPGETGEIRVSSPCCMQGYLGAVPEQPFDEQGYLCTGDLGYTDAAGNLFVLAREKTIIKQGGFTIYPADVEEAVSGVPGVRTAAAIGIPRKEGEGESLIIMAETDRYRGPSADDYHRLIVKIAARVRDFWGIRPARVWLLKPKSLPRTPNGKLQYALLKVVYLKKGDVWYSRVLYPELPPRKTD